MITRKEYHDSKNNSRNLHEIRNNVDNPEDVQVDKSKRLARRLNWTIFFLILGIIAVYLILIYVNP
ncbi:hypothetical protein [Apilactobacillus bombintestini]|uniref:Uncharacterized protein n=1 Tax=Apilactobacillus bombintestini TaxID=2419772 RepID=A0A387ASW3_9LACO|nr:hypothetical protein [Apilactobacillus bombintestini]AYF92439.1 hypothetical protein D7I45_02640 [Apilactobacillus bombintestini]